MTICNDSDNDNDSMIDLALCQILRMDIYFYVHINVYRIVDKTTCKGIPVII